jgi:hypothetical protein
MPDGDPKREARKYGEIVRDAINKEARDAPKHGARVYLMGKQS